MGRDKFESTMVYSPCAIPAPVDEDLIKYAEAEDFWCPLVARCVFMVRE